MASPAAPRKWTSSEDLQLRAECERQSRQTGAISDWMAIADKMPNRTNKDCRKRWSKVCASLKKGPWSNDEDSRLQRGVNQHGCKWTLVAQVVTSRSADQCAKRWQHSLDPHLDRSEWKPEEDRVLLEAILVRRLKSRPSFLPPLDQEDDDEDDYASDSELEHRPSQSRAPSSQQMQFHSSSSHPNVPAMAYGHSMPDGMPGLSPSPYLSPDYRSSASTSPPTGSWDQNMGLMDSRLASSSRSSSSEIFTPNDMTSMMDPMVMGHDMSSMMNQMGMGHDGATNMMDEGFTSEMLACMNGSSGDTMDVGADAASMTSSRASTTLTITIEDADPNHIDGITSMLLRSKTRFRMQQS